MADVGKMEITEVFGERENGGEAENLEKAKKMQGKRKDKHG